jgi:hypothetical protein
MKFRLQCAGCGATFFSPDRKARYCPKCVRKGVSKTGAAGAKRREAKPPIERSGAKPERAAPKEPKPRATPVNRTPKITVLTPELSEQVAQLYQAQFAGGETPMDEVITQISDRTWVARKAVRSVINKILHPDVPITPELKERVIEMYKGYVERSERPAKGRRRTIADAVGVPLSQVMKIVYEWSLSQYNASPTPELSRQQRFEIEKLYWDEMDRKRHRYDELPEKIAERLGYANAYQIRRLLDMFHDDWNRFKNVADPPPEVEQRILEAYKQYLAAPQPPEQGLHSTIANQIGGLTSRQVHKVLQRYRYQRRDEYPLK